MNYSKDGFRVSHHEQKYLCSFCNFRTHKKYNLDMHTKNKHGTSQTGSGALLEEQTDPHHVQQEIFIKILYQLKLTIMYSDNGRGGPQHTKIYRQENNSQTKRFLC